MRDVAVVIMYRALPGQAGAALQAISSLVATVLAREPDCHGIEILQDQADPARITLLERWPTRESYVGPHFQQPHIQAFIQQAGPLFAGPPDISFWSTRDIPAPA